MDIAVECQQLQRSIEQAVCDFHRDADVNRLLLRLRTLLMAFVEQLAVAVIEHRLQQPGFLADLKARAAKSAFRFKGFKATSICLLTGRSFSIHSPYFARAAPKNRRGRKRKKRTAKTGCHLGLSHMGLLDRCSAVAASAAAQAAVLCPSFDIARQMLSSFGLKMNVKTIQRLCHHIGDSAIEHRHRIALSDADTAAKRILMATLDGGRLRERRAKRGRRPAGLKRQGYHTDWKEPTQLVIQWIDEDGTKSHDIAPIYDATMADTDRAFELMEAYLRQLDCTQADIVVFCADGARRYWSRFQSLAKRLKLPAHIEVIDYTHAKQNLNEILDRLPSKLQAKERADIVKHCYNLLWQGDISALGQQIRLHIKGRKKRKKALAKFKSYFLDNYRRMQYAAFKNLKLPTGSGCVESAIRRVINLRLKSPGIFWKRKTAEVMLFLRSTLLCGRWKIMLDNLLAINRGELAGCP
jgi:hypothetical protein